MREKTVPKCEQACGADATVYGGGRSAGDWAGYYCQSCLEALAFIVFDRLDQKEKAR